MQTYTHEVVVVDDGSDDCSREIMRPYGDRIIARHKDRGGQVSVVNMAFALSHGDIVFARCRRHLPAPEGSSG